MTRSRYQLLTVTGLLAGLVALGMVTLAGGAAPTAPAPAAPASAVPVLGSTVFCPDVRQDGALTTRLSVGAAPLPGRPDATGRVQLRALGASSTGTAPATSPATVLPVDAGAEVAIDLGAGIGDDAAVVTAAGSLAGGLQVEQSTRSPGPGDRGLAVLRCSAPGTEAWFVGGSTSVGDSALLVLANPDTVDAVVDVRGWSGEGVVDPRAGAGIVVPARARAAVRVDDLAPGRSLLALHLSAVRGRFVAALKHSRVVAGTSPAGVEWVPPSPPPALSVVLPGLPPGPGTRSVQVTNPGAEDTQVSLQLTTADGQFVPLGVQTVQVPAGTSVTRDVTAQLGQGAAAVAVLSDEVPVLATGFAVEGLTEIREIAYAGAAGPLTGPALVLDVTVGPGADTTLLLSALSGDGDVVVTPVPLPGNAGPSSAPRTVPVPGGRTATLRLSTLLPPGAPGRFAVVVAPLPGSAPVHAARYVQQAGAGGPLLAVQPLRSGTRSVLRPVVGAEPAAGTR